jgi:hypothetical protein
MIRMSLRHVALLPMLAALGACAGGDKPAEAAATAAPAAPPVVEVTANDYAFQMPDTLAAGVTTFRLTNHGQELHHVILIKLGEGQTLADLPKLLGGPPPADLVVLGGPNPAPPHGQAEAVVDLQTGNYAVICVIPAADGQAHVQKGMAHALTVIPGTSTAAMPEADIVVTLKDYDFEFSTPLTAGRHVLRIENAAEQMHELVFFKLAPGKTAAEMAHFAEKREGPPPGTPINGASPLSKGMSNTVTVDLEAGDYALICFAPDAKDGKPHLVHGMIKQLTIS